MKKLGLFTLLLAFCCLQLTAQTYNVTVSGHLSETGSGNPIPNYPVDIAFDSSFFSGFSYNAQVLTDVNGDYSDVVTVPGGVPSGTGHTGVRDCTPSGYFTNNFSYSTSSTTISNLDFQICLSSGGCQAWFTFVWNLGSTLVNFTDGSTSFPGSVTSWSWDFGDGTFSNLQNPSHVYNSMGPFVVCLTMGTSQGCTGTYCDTVSVGSSVNCNASLTATVTPSGVATFSASGSGTGSIVGYYYEFGDGVDLNSSSATETHTYTANGVYNACVTVFFSDSCQYRTCTTVTVGGAFGCQASYYWYPDTSGQYSIILVNQSSGTGLTYQWSFGDGTGSTAAYPSHQYNGPGTYVVCVTVTSTNPSCTSTYCDTLVVLNKVNAPFTINVISTATSVNPGQNNGPAVALYPNPARDFLMVDVTLENMAPVYISLVDLSGKTVRSFNQGELAAGKHNVRLSTQDLPAGMYLARVTAGNGASTHKVMIAR